MNIVDYIILGVLAISLLYGMYRGFISGVLSLLGTLGAIAGAYLLSGRLSQALHSNETLVNTLMYYMDAGTRVGSLDLSMTTVSQATQGAITQLLDAAKLPAVFENLFVSALQGAAGNMRLSTLLGQTIVDASITLISFLICFLGCYIVMTFLVHMIGYVFELPVLRHLDALVGGLFGLVKGVLMLYIAFLLVPIVLSVAPVPQISELIASSQLAPFFDSRLVLSILGRVG